MVAYTDLPAATALYDEQERINQALILIDAGGTISSFTIIPPPPLPPDPMNPPTSYMMTMQPVMLSTVAPTPEMLQVTRDAIVARSAQITTDLLALGVTDPPPDPVPESSRRKVSNG